MALHLVQIAEFNGGEAKVELRCNDANVTANGELVRGVVSTNNGTGTLIATVTNTNTGVQFSRSWGPGETSEVAIAAGLGVRWRASRGDGGGLNRRLSHNISYEEGQG